MKRLSSTLLTTLLLLATAGCAGTPPSTAPPGDGTANADEASTDAPTFSDVQPLLADTFVPLLTEDEELDASSWRSLMAGSEHGTVVIPYDAEHSLLMEVARHARAEGRAGAPTPAQLDRVRRWIEAGARSDAGAVPYADAENLLYVANEAGALVTIIDTDENRVVRTVDLTERGFGPNSKPHDTAVGPNGDYWYLSLISVNRVLKFNRDNEIVGRIEFEAPGLMKLDPNTERLFVGRSMGAVNPPKSIGIVSGPQALDLRIVDVFFPRPHALAVDPSGQQAYVASLAQNQVAGINAASGQMELTSMGGPVNTLVHFDVSPDGQTLASGGQISGKFFFFDLSETPLTPRVTDSLQLGGQPWHPTYTPSGERLYVPQKTANAVSVIDAEAREVETVIRHEALAQPHGSAVRPDGRYVYVTGSNVKGTYAPRYPGVYGDENRGTVVVIDTRTNEVVKVLRADQDPSGASRRPAS